MSSEHGNSVAMDRYSEEDRIFCVDAFFRSNSATAARRDYRKHRNYKNFNKCPSERLIRSWVKKFREQGHVRNENKKPRECSVRTPEMIAAVRRILEENPQTSGRSIAATVGASVTTVQKIIKIDIKVPSPKTGKKRKQT